MIRTVYFLIVLFLVMNTTSCNAQNGNEEKGNFVAHSYVVAPDVPDKMIFAGEEIHFNRYDLRERMDRELISFCYMHSSTLLIFKRANRYFPVVEPILARYGVPDDFKYLMAIESSLLIPTRSPAGAAGLWQFMESTGREYGLEVNQNIDERYHVEKSTEAACRYLRDAYEKYGDWWSVAASYNAGQGRISAELERQGEDTALDLWLNTETSRYMFRIMALKCIMENPQKYGFKLKAEQLYPPMEYDIVTVNTGIDSLTVWAKEHGVSYYQLKESNYWMRGRSLMNKSGRTYMIKVPKKESINYNPQQTVPHEKVWCIDN